MIEPRRFLEQLRSDAFDIANAPEIGELRVPALSRAVLDRLEEAGVSADSQLAYYRHERTNVHAEVHAYACDTEDDVISLFYLVDGNEDVPLGEPASVANVSKDLIDRAFRRLEAFVRLAHAGRPPDLDQSQPASELFELVRSAGDTGQKIVLNVLALGTVSERAATSEKKSLEREVWDLDRLVKTCGGDGDERPAIDFVGEFGLSLPCLVTSKTDDGLQVFMTWIRGDILAQIYNTYRSRLLERNVRSFLQFC